MSLWGEYLEELLDVSFNGKSFQSVSGGQVTDHNFDEFPEIKESSNQISSAHRSVTAGRFFVSKRASVDIAVHGEFHELQAILARFRQLIQYKNKSLVLTRGVPIIDGADVDLTQTTQITFKNANLVAANMNHNATKGTVITVDFRLDDPIGVGGTPQIIYTTTGRTAALTTIDLSTLDLQGTFQEQYPIYKIKINSVTNGSNPTIEIENGLNILTLAQTVAGGDEIIIDTNALSVKVNGEMVDFSGSLPFISDPDSIIYIRDTFSARSIDIEVKNDPRYI